MAVGLEPVTDLAVIPGIRLSVASAGIKSSGKTDLVLITCDQGSQVAAVFTKNRFCAAPVSICREHLASGRVRAALVNSGNANAGTGVDGIENARACCESLARVLGIESDEVLPFSTGVIGQRLPVEKITGAIPGLVESQKDAAWVDAARGIMTTDTMPKGRSARIQLSAGEVNLTAIAKGAGMIRPDMATLLVFMATDANIAANDLQVALERAADVSFNRITVDGDTSTNDSCLLMATGKSGINIEPGSKDYELFEKELTRIATELAQDVIRDAEGITKFITLNVINGATEKDCLDIAYTIAHSPLVKTAFFASDANWGRILAAVGRAPVDIELPKIRIMLDEVTIVENGGVAASYTEEAGQQVMNREEITVTVDLDQGNDCVKVWTTDLSHDYVKINAEYRS
ncbi:MAG: bifunctional glutamate N-acetyltransferase/amino-acid acetyltransferase ArgJ [Gammaproteobacteria bacterium]|nr:bifunctional glutamate N-acetyltransferase/amino-acid acetyltransferase ArgJ [Gammaproteobacteria bacterium]